MALAMYVPVCSVKQHMCCIHMGFSPCFHLLQLQGTAVVPSAHLVQGCRQMLPSLCILPWQGLISSPPMDILVASTSYCHTHSQPYIHADKQSAATRRRNQTFFHSWSNRTRAQRQCCMFLNLWFRHNLCPLFSLKQKEWKSTTTVTRMS